jgi:hypothetical protein
MSHTRREPPPDKHAPLLDTLTSPHLPLTCDTRVYGRLPPLLPIGAGLLACREEGDADIIQPSRSRQDRGTM